MRDSGIEMVSYMCGPDFVMKEINNTPRVKFVVGTVNGVKGSFDIVMVIIGEMGYINISMLKPTCRTRTCKSYSESNVAIKSSNRV